jgi:hypothetical protein
MNYCLQFAVFALLFSPFSAQSQSSSTIPVSHTSLKEGFSKESNNCSEVRYTFDIGSASAKLGVLKVNHCQSKIISFLKSDVEHLSLQHCLSESADHNTLTDACIEQELVKLNNVLKRNNIDCAVARCAGIATAWARYAKNSNKFLQKLAQMGLKIKVISQEDEGKFAYCSAMLHPIVQGVDAKEEVAILDVGGGSFQIGIEKINNIQIVGGKIGVFNIKKYINQHLPHEHRQNLYYNKEEFPHALKMAVKLVRPYIESDKHLKEMAEKNKVQVFAVGLLFLDGLMTKLAFNHIVKKDELLLMAQSFSGMTEEEVINKYPEMNNLLIRNVQVMLMLLYAILENLQVEQFEIVDARLFDYIALEDEFWN